MYDYWLSPRDLSERLKIPLQTIYRWRLKGEGPTCYRLGRHLRFRPEDVDAWLEEHRDGRSSDAA